MSLLPFLCIAVYPDRVSSSDGFIPDDRFMTVCQKASRGPAVTVCAFVCACVCVCKKERNMFSKRTHSHPKNTGVDSEKYSSRVLICLFCTSAYLLSHRFVITDKHQMANVLFPSKKKNKLLIDRVANLI